MENHIPSRPSRGTRCVVPVRGMEPLRARALSEASIRVEAMFWSELLNKGEHGYGMALV